MIFFGIALLICTILSTLGVGSTATRREVLGCLLGLTVDRIVSLRGQIFDECKRTGLCEEEDEIRLRLEGKDTKPMKQRLSEDMWLLVLYIRGKKLPSIILKNGNRSKSYLSKSRAAVASSSQAPSHCFHSCSAHDLVSETQSCDTDPTGVSWPLSEQRDSLVGAVLKRDLEDLRKDVQMLRSNLQFLQKEKSNREHVSTYHVRVRLHLDLTKLFSKELGTLLTCKVLNSTVVSRQGKSTLKVKIPLFVAFRSWQNSHNNVSPWCNAPQSSLKARKYPANQTNITNMFHPMTLPTNVLRICTWNCRSIHSGRAYLLSL